MTKVLATLALLNFGAAEVITGDYRAVTMESGQRRHFRVPKLETITGSSGRCVEEGMTSDEPDTIWVHAECGGVRTSLLWKKDGSRVHVMVCAEDLETRTHEQLKFRQKIEKELKGAKSVTACVRNGRVELWGWVKTAGEQAQLDALVKKHAIDGLKNNAELIKTEE
ncbi:MAG: hypothetical protein ACO1OB_15100 [Archangium sp.]